jgi:endonuclease YncB( thermonuclease family)
MVAAFLLCCGAMPSAHAEEIACKVVGVTDGDTLTCLTEDRRQIIVRLADIDAPEISQPFGQRAKQALSRLCFGKAANLDVVTTDRYGRSVANIACGEEADVSTAMVRLGMAWVYDKYVGDRSLYRVQGEARADQVGLWRDAEPVQPWVWRHDDGAGSVARVAAAVAPAYAVQAQAVGAGFTCGMKTTCREMSSCAEARFYLTQCGLTRLDRDHDGIPCESICR